jgi:prepilin-type N-terminal cleavage/methylation domain-containing protein
MPLHNGIHLQLNHMRAASQNAQRGFTLVELAVVMAILALLLGAVMYTLTAQQDQQQHDETGRTLEMAREAVLGFGIASGRLPCPASATSNGAEDCTLSDGYLPALTIGFQPADAAGYARDRCMEQPHPLCGRRAIHSA